VFNSLFGLFVVGQIVAEHLSNPFPPPISFALGLFGLAYGARAIYRRKRWRRATGRVVESQFQDSEFPRAELKISFPVDDLIYRTNISIPIASQEDARAYVGREIEISYWPGNPYFPQPTEMMTGVIGSIVAIGVGAFFVISAFML
jgi:hypothetical protein